MQDAAPEPEVRTAAGVLRGSRETGLAVFRGVPYAEPPVGALRFAAPRPVRGWAGLGRRSLTARRLRRPACSGWTGSRGRRQAATGFRSTSGRPIPAPGAGLPVLVSESPGGGYVIGMSSLPEFDSSRLAAGGAVVVTLNYRLGVEGFAQIDGAPANRGLLTRSPRCSGYATTSGPSAATRTG